MRGEAELVTAVFTNARTGMSREQFGRQQRPTTSEVHVPVE
jgi:hypothetical protein